MKCIIETFNNVNSELDYLTQIFKDETQIGFSKKGFYLYKNEPISNFFFIFNDVRTVYSHKGNPVEFIYLIDMIFLETSHLVKIEISSIELSNAKWMKSISAPMIILFDIKYYKVIVNYMITNIKNKSTNFFTTNIGINYIKGEYIFSNSNSIITEEGIDYNSNALLPDYDFNFSDNDEQEAFYNFINYTKRNFKILIPIHLMSIMAICRNFFSDIGINFGMNLWIDGNYGSGKTELATVAGNYYNRQPKYNSFELKKNLLVSNMKHRTVVDKLKLSNNAVFVLDDVKKEETSKNREAAKNNIDFVIRTIFLGHHENELINTVSIITGEYFNNQSSTVERLLYMNIEDFLSDKNNKNLLSDLQTNNYYLSDFIFWFIKWFIYKINREGMKEVVKKIYEKVKYTINDHQDTKYCSERVKDTIVNFCVAFELIELYSRDQKMDYYIKEIKKDVQNVLINWGNSTELLVEGLKPLIKRAFFASIYQTGIYRKYRQDSELKNDNIENVILKSLTPKYSGIYMESKKDFYSNNQEVILLVKINKIIPNIIKQVKNFAEKYNIYVSRYQTTQEYIVRMLSEMHLIWSAKRIGQDGFNREFRLIEIRYGTNPSMDGAHYAHEYYGDEDNYNDEDDYSNENNYNSEDDYDHEDDNKSIDNPNQKKCALEDCWDAKNYENNIIFIYEKVGVLKININHPEFEKNYLKPCIYNESSSKISKMYKVVSETSRQFGITSTGHIVLNKYISEINNATDLE